MVDEGEKVSAGQVVVSLFDRDARMRVAAAEAEISRAQKTLDAAKRGGARVRKTQQDVQVVRSSVSLAKANLRMANEELKKTVIRSPISGTVAARHV